MKNWSGAATATAVFLAVPQAFAQEGDAGRGQRLFNQQCRAEAMKKSGIVWDAATISEYSRDPKAKVPDTKWVYGGMKQPGQLADLVAYLKQATQ